MLGEGDKDGPSGGNRKAYLRSVSWAGRSPTKSSSRPQWNSKARACLPPLQPLSITRPSTEEWPTAGSDDLGIWPSPPTPGLRLPTIKSHENSNSQQHPKEFEFKKDKLAFFDKECSRILDHVYLASDAVAKNREILRKNGITHVLNCVGFVCPEYFKNDLVYKTLWLQDTPSEDITSVLYDVFDYFEDVQEQGGRVLVHCCQGVSRSNSLVIAYLMWKEGQSFEDAFQHVKAARGVTNPNMGFACQLLQCQKRVHAVPASPNSVLRMYRMAPHSPYDPLHLVPKMLSQPGAQALDSRGAFVIHVPSAIYVWIGKSCSSVMSDNAREAAFQVIRYERAQGPFSVINEGKEQTEFWDALDSGCRLADDCGKAETKEEERSVGNDKADAVICPAIYQRKVDEYNVDFEIFHKAIAGGVVPPSALSGTESETCLPARENGWGILRRKIASGIVKELVSSSKLSCDTTCSSHGQERNMNSCEETEYPVSSPFDRSLPSSPQCDSPDSFSSFANNSPHMVKDNYKVEEHSFVHPDPLVSPTATCSSPDSFSCFLVSQPNFSSTSPSLSPSTPDYASSFSFSPSSSNWSDLSYLSVQPSPSGLESTDPYPAKDACLEETNCLSYQGAVPAPAQAFASNHSLREAKSCLPCRGTSPSIAERRGSNFSLRMMLPVVDDVSHVKTNLERSWSFSLPDLKDDLMGDAECSQFEVISEMNREEPMLDADILAAGSEFHTGIQDKNGDDSCHDPSSYTIDRVAEVSNLVLYQWPSMHKVEMHCFSILDSSSVYIIFMPDVSLDADTPVVLYIWVGHDFSSGKGQNLLVIGSDGTCKNVNHDWETVGHNFLIQKGFTKNSRVQIVREGEEPEQLLKHLHWFSFEKTSQVKQGRMLKPSLV